MSGQPVDSFTQQDIDSGVISYVHGTGDKQLNKTSLRLTLQVNTIYVFLLSLTSKKQRKPTLGSLKHSVPH